MAAQWHILDDDAQSTKKDHFEYAQQAIQNNAHGEIQSYFKGKSTDQIDEEIATFEDHVNSNVDA